MKKLLAASLVAISMATWAEGGKLVSIDEVDCEKVIESARASCIEERNLSTPEVRVIKRKKRKDDVTPLNVVSGEMNVYTAQAVIKATYEEISSCRINLDVYGNRKPEKVNPCLKKVASMLADDSDFHKAREYLTSLDEETATRQLSSSDMRQISFHIKEIVKDKEYILYRLQNQ